MRIILALFPILMMAKEGFDFNVDFGSRLSGKNIVLYLSLMIIGLRMAREGRLRIEFPYLQLCFAILIVYAMLTWWVAAFIIEYELYPVRQNGILLKILLIDRYIVFLAFFYGARSVGDVIWVLKALLVVILAAHFVTVGESWGLLPTSYTTVQGSGRVNGVLGEANQYASVTALFIPALLAMAMSHRGLERGFWVAGVIVSAICLMLAFSRGALLAFVGSMCLGAFLFRQHLSPGLVARWGTISAVVLTIGTAIVTVRYGDVLYTRFVEDTLGAANLSDLSKGRIGLWTAALDKMLDEPVTLLTGFGWRAYWSLPHVLAPHNTYLDFWFNLGLPGLLGFVGIFGIGIVSAYQAAKSATDPVRLHLIAFIFGILGVAIAIFFTEWYEPWSYFWPYFGLMMRLVWLAEQPERTGIIVEGVDHDSPALTPRQDRFGWTSNRSRTLPMSRKA
jgi:O-antigen ligase